MSSKEKPFLWGVIGLLVGLLMATAASGPLRAQAVDNFSSPGGRDQTVPVTHCVAVTPSNTVDLSFTTRAIAADTAGVAYVDMQSGSDNVAIPLAAGVLQAYRVDRIYSTGLTAGNIVACE